MSKLASRWASEEDLVKEALHQDAHVNDKQPALLQKTMLPSKWADAPLPHPAELLPTPPHSAGRHDRLPRKRGDGRPDHKHKDKQDNTHKDDNKQDKHYNKQDKQEKHHHKQDYRHNDDRHKEDRHKEDKHKGDRFKEDKHKGERFKEDKHARSKRERHDKPNGENPHDVLYDKGPSTDASRTLAMRIGAPKEVQAKKGEEKLHKKRGENSASLKYLTPRQKREMEAREKARAEESAKEARLQQEVKEMFEKMSDTTTSWADIDGEW